MGALSIEQILAEEAAAIHGENAQELVAALTSLETKQAFETERADKDADRRSGRDEDPEWVKNRKNFYCKLNSLNRAALCFSGGGIRSATFCLGVLQALAGHRPNGQFTDEELGVTARREREKNANESLLSRFHFLSTVSGGGYIGSWLSAWRHYNDFPTVWQSLSSRPDGPDVEPAEISWLRAYSNYLTPKVGLASADTWTGIAIYLRNLILNWLVIVPALAVVLIVLKAIITVSVAFARWEVWGLHITIALIGVAMLIVAQRFTTTHRPTRRKKPRSDPITETGNVSQTDYLLGDLIWSILSALLLTSALTSVTGATLAGNASAYHAILIGAVFGVVIFAGGWIAGLPLNCCCGDFIRWALSGLVYGGLVALGAHLYGLLMPYSWAEKNSIWMILLPVIFGVPWVLVAQLCADMVFVGLVSYEINSDDDREWLGRAAGWVAASAIIWILGTFIVFAGGYFLIDYVWGKILAPYIASLGGIAGVVSALIAKSATAVTKTGADEKGSSGLVSTIVLAIAGPLFAVILIVGVSVGLDLLLLHDDSLINVLTRRSLETCSILFWLGVGLAVALFIAWVASRNVNINRFSIHALYRNRLVRAYLGASRQQRSPDCFTGFDNADNVPAHKLWPPQRNEATGGNTLCLFHVVNITLNLVKATRLAWQQRKAESFTVSPLHCGAAYKGYRYSNDYAGGTSGDGITLGTAMAISGAAASPNMGYHSSPSITLLLALLNVRLGWWLGNPGKEGDTTYKEEGPRTAIKPLVDETFGQTTDTNPWVYLSDGGHFENLGIYEMVRRRCRFILAVDAGCDPKFAFEDLGNAVRKIYIDLGIRIVFKDLDTLKNRPTPEELSEAKNSIPYCAIGKIHYEEADGKGCKDGWVLYVKPAYHGTSSTEGAGVRSYATAHKDFPHEPTADQWFSESQFESYRSLALDIMNNILRGEEQSDRSDLNAILAGLVPTARG